MTTRKFTPSKNERNRRLFRKAADILRRGKWTRDHWFKGDKPGGDMLGAYCLTGAILKAEAVEKGQEHKLTDDDAEGRTYETEPWYRELQEVLGEAPEAWNDRRGQYGNKKPGAKNKQEVIEVLESLAGDES